MTTIVIMPGGFHPWHGGHTALYQSTQKAFPGAEVFVAATNDTSARPFPFAVKEKLAKLAGVATGHFVQVKSPFRAKEITSKFDPARDRLIFVRSEKDADKPPQAGGVKQDGSAAYLQPLAGQTNIRPFKEHAYMAYLPTVEFGPGMTSATEIRTAWPTLNEKRKTALVMSLYPRTQSNPKLANTVVKLLDAAIGTQDVTEDITEAVGGNYLYYSRETADEAKQILSSGYILGNTTGKQPASDAQTTLPTVSFGRNIGYQISGANVDRDYQVVFVFDRASIETRYKTLGTSQSQTVRGLANPIDTEWGRKVTKLGKAWGLDSNADGKVDYKEIRNASKSTASNLVKQGVSTQLNAPKAGGEFEEIVPTKTGKIPLQGLLVGFYLVPGKAASKDPELLNDPRRLDMIRPNQFVKAARPQAVAEGESVSLRDMVNVVDQHYPKYYAELSGSDISDKQFERAIENTYKKIMQKQGVAEGSKMLSLDDKIKIYATHKSKAQHAENRGDYTTADTHKKQASKIYSNIVNLHFGDDGKDAQNAANEYIRKSQGVAERIMSGPGTPQWAGSVAKAKTVNMTDTLWHTHQNVRSKHMAQLARDAGHTPTPSMISAEKRGIRDDEKRRLSKQPTQGVAENFADGRNPQDKGDAKRHGVPTKASVSTLRKVAKQGGRKGQLAHWMANMKAGRAKKEDVAEEPQHNPVDENQGWAATLEHQDYIEEKWSQKYKSSINCANPQGFSQKAHCAGRKK